MKYFFHTEFIEGKQTIRQWGLKTDTWLRIAGVGFIALGIYVFLGIHSYSSLWFFVPSMIMFSLSMTHTPPTIDLISIGIVSEDGREYYVISKDFNLKEAWNRYQWKTTSKSSRRSQKGNFTKENQVKEYWIRENVLLPIFYELNEKDLKGQMLCLKEYGHPIAEGIPEHKTKFTYKRLKYLINKYGKTNNQIAEEVKEFCFYNYWINPKEINKDFKDLKDCLNLEFYAYYADYDWVVFCWLFGRMIDLPKEFPMYCRDLKQILDEKVNSFANIQKITANQDVQVVTFKDKLNLIKSMPNYPKQQNEHNALADARWNKELHLFIESFDITNNK